MTDRVVIAPVRRLANGRDVIDQELVAVESPLGVEVARIGRDGARSMGVLMRTPGDDEDLVRGFLYGEGVIQRVSDIASIEHTQTDTIRAIVDAHIDIDAILADSPRIVSSACGLCGRLSIESLDSATTQLSRDRPLVSAGKIAALPAALQRAQAVFAETGGLHAAALFDPNGELLALREDVGRHNAVDKLVGAALAAGWLPASETILTVSGRVAFEIVQKAGRAGIPVIVAIGAPSSLAVDAARRLDMTLAGFTRNGRFNLYSGGQRVIV